MNSPTHIGYVDGSTSASTQRFSVVLEESAVIQLDDVIICDQELADGRMLRHFGIVVESTTGLEGAALSSDTKRITGNRTMPGERFRVCTVQVLRTEPELWIPPNPGAEVHRATGISRDMALFQDRMGNRALKVGLDHTGLPVSIDWSFANGEKGAHFSVSGISGVATKTSYALFLLYMLFETDEGKALLGRALTTTRAVIFNVKGEDLVHLDRMNSKFADDLRAQEQWQQLGVFDPHPFRSVAFFSPPRKGDTLVPDITQRRHNEVSVFGFTPLEFIQRGLLSLVFNDTSENTQVPYIVEHLRAQLIRHAVPSSTTRGAVIMRNLPVRSAYDFEQAAEQLGSHPPEVNQPGDTEIKNFRDLVNFVSDRIDNAPGEWTPGTAPGTADAFRRRFLAMSKRLGHLVRHDVTPLVFNNYLNVIDINKLHEDAQRFVVGAVLDQIWTEKQSAGREPLRFIVLDELNKYAPREGKSPIKELLVDVAARGRSLGVILIGCQQNAAGVESAVVDNAAIKAIGRLDASHVTDYRFLPSELQERAMRLLPGTMILQQPVVPAPIPISFPFPPYATNDQEDNIGAAGVLDEHGVADDPFANLQN